MTSRRQYPELFIMVARLSVRAFDYVGGDKIPPTMDADQEMQTMAREGFDLVGGEANARKIAKNSRARK